jgi:hypothetical protein
LEKVGFHNVELIGETGFNSTPKTKGVLLRAKKPALPAKLVKPPSNAEHSDGMVHPAVKKTPPAIEAVLEKAYAFGCEKAKIIDTSTVIIEKWTRWKCLYGCPFYNKDGYHPPFAPSVEETKEVLGEYTKAILLNGPKGKELTNVAVRLEGEAYQMGFYKAFALTALPSGSGEKSNSGAT